MPLREPTFNERSLIEFLLRKSGEELYPNGIDKLEVHTMDDGGMGSLRLFPKSYVKDDERVFGRDLSEVDFQDEDGVKVIATLILTRMMKFLN